MITSSVECERDPGFSLMNSVKTDIRSGSLSLPRLDDLLMTGLNGPALQDEEHVQQLLEKSFDYWMRVRSRNMRKSHCVRRPLGHGAPQKYDQVLRRCLLGQQTQRLKLRIQRVRVMLMCLVPGKSCLLCEFMAPGLSSVGW